MLFVIVVSPTQQYLLENLMAIRLYMKVTCAAIINWRVSQASETLYSGVKLKDICLCVDIMYVILYFDPHIFLC